MNDAELEQLLDDLESDRVERKESVSDGQRMQKHRLKGCDVAVVVVGPADAPPVRLKGVAWVRVGPRRAIASPQEERLLAERRRHHPQGTGVLNHGCIPTSPMPTRARRAPT